VAGPSPSQPHPEDTQLRVRQALERSLRAGEVVFEEGEPGDEFYVLQAGEVELSRHGPAGRHPLARLGPGDIFGELCVLVGGARRTRATAVSDVRVLALEAATLQAMCIEQPEIAIRVIRRLATRVVELETRLAALGADDLLRVVVRALLRLAEPGPQGARVATSLRGLAETSGLGLLETHRALHALIDAHRVRLVDDELRIPDLETLSAALDPV
jgi:CRP/FNR family cyclic AMP-dependent transcriptional regulator